MLSWVGVKALVGNSFIIVFDLAVSGIGGMYTVGCVHQSYVHIIMSRGRDDLVADSQKSSTILTWTLYQMKDMTIDMKVRL